MELGRFHVIVDVGPVGPDPFELTRSVIRGGAPLVQIRPKGVTDRDAYVLVRRIAELCRSNGALCVVNDRPDLALAVGADGCHVGEHDLPVRVVRGLLGLDAIVGGTARDPVAAAGHQRDGATYLGVGPVYPTSSKLGLPDPIGVSMVRAVADAVDIPVIAISGVTVDRVPELIRAGAYGVAVIGAVARADDPYAMTVRFVETICQSVAAS